MAVDNKGVEGIFWMHTPFGEQKMEKLVQFQENRPGAGGLGEVFYFWIPLVFCYGGHFYCFTRGHVDGTSRRRGLIKWDESIS